jgi:alkylated DNA nucleotide flippase Atl1
MTYGQIAELLGDGYTPRTVGFCMHSSPEGTPWHASSTRRANVQPAEVVQPHDKQQRLLELEGVVFDKNARCDLQQFLFIPKTSSQKPRGASLYKPKNSTRGEKR